MASATTADFSAEVSPASLDENHARMNTAKSTNEFAEILVRGQKHRVAAVRLTHHFIVAQARCKLRAVIHLMAFGPKSQDD